MYIYKANIVGPDDELAIEIADSKKLDKLPDNIDLETFKKGSFNSLMTSEQLEVLYDGGEPEFIEENIVGLFANWEDDSVIFATNNEYSTDKLNGLLLVGD